MHPPRHRRLTLPLNRPPRALSWTAMALGAAALVAAVGLHLASEWARARDEAQARLDIAATATAIYLDQVVGTMTLALATVDDGWARADYARDSPAIRRLLAARMGAAPAIMDLALVDEHGVLLFGGAGARSDEARLDLSWRDWFKRAAEAPTRDIIVSDPLQPVGAGPAAGRSIVPLSHGIRDGAGRLRGVAVLAVDPEQILAAASLPEMERFRLELLVSTGAPAPSIAGARAPSIAGAVGPELGDAPAQAVTRVVGRSGGALSIRLSAPAAEVFDGFVAHTLLPELLLAFMTLLLAGACVLLRRSHRRRVGLMRANAGQLQALCDAAGIGFFRLGAGSGAAWGETISLLTGVPSFSAFSAMLSAEDRAAVEAVVLAPDALASARSVLVHVAHPERGARRMRVQVIPGWAELELGCWGYVRDETDLIEQLEDAAHQQRMDILGSLTAGVAHDFNNLMCALSLTLEGVRTGAPGAQSAAQVDQAQRLVDRGADLTAQLLAYARRQPLRCIPVHLDQFFADAARVVRQTLGPLHPLLATIAPNLGHGELDPALLQTVLVRLALNAREAMPGGGTVSLGAARVTLGVSESLELGAQPGPFVRITMADCGAGMPAEQVAHAFDPFREPTRLAVGSGGPVQAGTFSGLPMVYGFALQAGGAVQMRSGIDDGTQVILYLPLPAGAAPSAPRPVATASPKHLPHLRILLVEDDPDLCDCTRALLEQQGATVTALSDGLSAVAKLGEHAEYDLLLSDVVLPGGVSGFDIVDGARRIRPALPALLMSGYAAPEVELGRERPERTALLQKPFSSVALIAAIQDTLDAYRPPDEPLRVHEIAA